MTKDTPRNLLEYGHHIYEKLKHHHKLHTIFHFNESSQSKMKILWKRTVTSKWITMCICSWCGFVYIVIYGADINAVIYEGLYV